MLRPLQRRKGDRMPEQLVPNIYDVLHSATCSPWLRRVLREVLADDRDPTHAAREGRLLSAVLDARAEAWRESVTEGAPAERQVALVDLFLPIGDAPVQAPHGNVIPVDFPNTAWRSNVGV